MLSRLPARVRSFAGVAVLSMLILTGSGTNAFADYTLTIANIAFPAPFGTVNVNRTDATHATVTFTAGASGGFTYKFGGEGAMNVNVNAGSWTVTSLTNNNPASSLSNSGSGNADGFGVFNQTLKNTDGSGDAFTVGSFILTNTSGTWANDADVLTPNAGDHNVAAHIFVYNSSGVNVFTGFASDGDNPPTPEVPEPATILSAVTALASFGFYGLRRRRQSADLAA